MSGPFELAPLPWEETALEPTIGARTIGFHYHKHHKTYVDTLNKLVQGTKFADMPLEKIVQATLNAKDGSDEKKIFNNAGQVWNHDFYWRSLTPKSGKPAKKLADAIERDFGSLDKLIEKLATDGKELLAAAAVGMLSPHETVFLDSSTTSYFVAREIISAGVAVTVLTNSLPVMNLLASEAGPNVELIGVGGTLRALTRSFVGAAATRTVNEHYGDRLFLSAKGIVDSDTLTDADSLEADVKRTMIAHARDAVLLIDGSKLNVRGLVAIAPLAQITVVLASGISAEQATALERAGTTVERVDAELR